MSQNNKTEKSMDKQIQDFLEELGMTEIHLKKVQDMDRYKILVTSSSDGDTKKAEYFSFKPRTGRISLVPLYDVHNGLRGASVTKLDAYLDYILKTEDVYTFLGGDACEAANKSSVGNAQQDERLHAGEQRREITNKLKPLADAGKILFGIPGNHEMRGHRYNEDNPMTEICYDLNIPYCGYSSFFTINVNSIEYKVIAHHGVGGGTTPAGAAAAAAKPAKMGNADLYITGHTHRRMVYDDAIFEIQGDKVVKYRKVYVVGGSLVNYLGMYPEEKCLQPSVTALVMITFDGNAKNISVCI
jgi:predicted phosphodiesterase